MNVQKYLFDLKETALNVFKASIAQSLCNIISGDSIELNISVSESMLSAFNWPPIIIITRLGGVIASFTNVEMHLTHLQYQRVHMA